MLDSVAALLTYQAGIYFATGHGAAAAGQSSPDDRAVRDIHRIRRRVRAGGRQRRPVAPVLRSRGARAWTNGSPPTASGSAATTSSGRFSPTASRPAPGRMDRRAERRRRAVRLGARPRELFGDPQIAARRHDRRDRRTPTIGSLQVLGTPLKLSDTPGSVRTAPPTLGQHTERSCAKTSVHARPTSRRCAPEELI